MALGQEVANYLAGAGIGLTISSSGTPVYGTPFPPESPAAAVAVIPYVSEGYVEAFGASLSGVLGERVRFQVVTRDDRDNMKSTEELANSINRVLRRYSGGMSVPGSTASITYFYVRSMGSPTFLKYDEDDRALYSCNYKAHKEEST